LASAAPLAYARKSATWDAIAMHAHQIVPPEALPRLTPEEYLAMELGSETRHELVEGYLYAITGALIGMKTS
jgi:hypothetical protein